MAANARKMWYCWRRTRGEMAQLAMDVQGDGPVDREMAPPAVDARGMW